MFSKNPFIFKKIFPRYKTIEILYLLWASIVEPSTTLQLTLFLSLLSPYPCLLSLDHLCFFSFLHHKNPSKTLTLKSSNTFTTTKKKQEMAKKKVIHQTQDPEQQNPRDQNQNLTTQHQHQQPSMEDPDDKFQSLKTVNDLLVKEAKQRRQQVESLVKAKEALETELALYCKEKSELESELGKISDGRVSLEIEKALFCVFIETRMVEMGSFVDGLVREKRGKDNEIGALESEVKGLVMNVETERDRLSRVYRERDLLKSDVDNWMKGADGLKDSVVELEKMEREGEEEIEKLYKQYALLDKEMKDGEKEIEELQRLRGLAENNLVEKVNEIEDLKREIGRIEKERNEIAGEKSEQKVKIGELERKAGELDEIVSSLQKEKGVLSGKAMELEKSLGLALEKENAMVREIDGLMEEKKEKERTIVRLMEEKDDDCKYKIMAYAEIEDKKGLIEELLREKNEIEEVKVIKEGEIVKLHEEVGQLRGDIFSMQESIKDREDKNKQVVSEASHYKDAFEKVRLERDTAQKSLGEERKNAMNLRSKVLEMEKRVEETVEERAKMKNEHESLVSQKKEMESQVATLEKEKDLLQKHFTEAERKIDELRTKIESAGTNYDRALAMLKNTAALLCESNNVKEDMIVTEKMLNGEIEPYASKLEVIKTAFSNKQTVVEEMKQQLEFLQNSVAKADKKNSLLSLLSSATAVVAAAVSLAYVARLR
jgi:chromosome segregation ATPase